jgi:hypothetical protein
MGQAQPVEQKPIDIEVLKQQEKQDPFWYFKPEINHGGHVIGPDTPITLPEGPPVPPYYKDLMGYLEKGTKDAVHLIADTGIKQSLSTVNSEMIIPLIAGALVVTAIIFIKK